MHTCVIGDGFESENQAETGFSEGTDVVEHTRKYLPRSKVADIGLKCKSS